jgi:plastocyanin
MKNIQLFLAILFASCLASLQAQINHTVTVQSNFFAPTSLTITQGDTVTWENLGGFHNVNGSQATYPDNPEGFINGNASGDSWTYSFVFNTPGTYDYQCDPHVGLGMTGQVIVEPIVLGPTDLLISGVFDGPLPGGQPKGIELYVINDIADLSVYGVGSANNGGGSDEQ